MYSEENTDISEKANPKYADLVFPKETAIERADFTL